MGTATPPLVSVMMPCYNARETLPMALASLLIQTYENWECVLVDDGSTDGTMEFISTLDDPRIRSVHLPQNKGRGVARQVALDHATGEFLCFLDADDWFYPQKIARQVEALMNDSRVAVVGTGAAVISSVDELTGVRRPPVDASESVRVIGPYDQLARPPVTLPTCMARMSSARMAAYNAELLLAQDLGFVLQVLIGRYLCMISDLLYAYRESPAQTFAKLIQTRHYDRQLYWSYRKTYPVQAAKQVVLATAKEIVYRGGDLIGKSEYFVARRSQPAPTTDLDEFLAARELVARTALSISAALPAPA